MLTNTQMMEKLKDWYPKTIGIANIKEIYHINEVLELDGRDITSLRNLRDTVVMMWMIDDAYMPIDDANLRMKKNDRMSAITGIIDTKIFNLGGEV